ncbi:hypothetical protein AMTRI_Chr10g3520 [Amborella trichopoda]
MHSSLIHQHPEPLHPTVASWPFSQWGMDIIGPIDPPSSLGHGFILAAIDYSSKWAEAVPLKQVLGTTVANFVCHHIIYRFGVPNRIISDNGPQFRSHHVDHLVNQFGLEWKYLTMYYP